MRHIEQIYINGEFVTPHGSEWFDLWNPATAQVTGQVRLADNVDAERAIAAAKAAFPAWAKTSKATRIAALRRMYTAVAARHDALLDAVIEEYGAPAARSAWMASYPAEVIAQAIEALEAYESTTQAGVATVQMTPLGVAGLITPTATIRSVLSCRNPVSASFWRWRSATILLFLKMISTASWRSSIRVRHRFTLSTSTDE
jgi:aldehyde dehydrogenase (NAD+)